MVDVSDSDSMSGGYFSGNIALNHHIPDEAALDLVKAWFGVERKEQVYQRTRAAYRHLKEVIEASKCPVPEFPTFDDIDPVLMTKAIEGLSDPAVRTEIAGWLLCPPSALKTADEQTDYREAISLRVKAEMQRFGIPDERHAKLMEALEFEPDYELKYLLMHDRHAA